MLFFTPVSTEMEIFAILNKAMLDFIFKNLWWEFLHPWQLPLLTLTPLFQAGQENVPKIMPLFEQLPSTSLLKSLNNSDTASWISPTKTSPLLTNLSWQPAQKSVNSFSVYVFLWPAQCFFQVGDFCCKFLYSNFSYNSNTVQNKSMCSCGLHSAFSRVQNFKWFESPTRFCAPPPPTQPGWSCAARTSPTSSGLPSRRSSFPQHPWDTSRATLSLSLH